ncbi:uncharacterized protein si:cabz01071907.1 [Cheilinus undulatus]|uniref:uncharacterized protein si:cabz01071907.1 n=1 Tax=Cheilinus undulatus TaxID=241271 RepID=UPI001BD2D6D7|nr:uncharacterized protein si:cabz01071907.1 [Cheilinus undulatus]
MANSSRRCHCSVPCCSNDKQTHPYLSFHDFPTDVGLRGRWVQAIRREEGATFRILRGSTYVCSLHFKDDDIYSTPKGLRRIKKGAVPSRFLWNDWGRNQTRTGRRLGFDATTDSEEDANAISAVDVAVTRCEHDYAQPPPPGTSDDASERIKELEKKVQELHLKLQQLTIQQQQPHMKRFCASDEDFRFYTRFPSEEVFMIFWESVSPSASRLVYWSKAQKGEFEAPSPHRKLHLIDECFMFFCRVAAGLKEKVLASIFCISVSTVSCTILTWTSYFYQVLGSLPIWMTREQVQATMPDKFLQYCPKVRVIIDCTELRCETSSSLTLQSETFSSYKNHTTFKGLIGIAPCGVITFISKLYTGSISDKEITRRACLTQYLQPGDGVMADEGFLIEDMLAEVGATLIIPPLKTAPQLSSADAKKMQAIACLRVLVERAIHRVKEYHIWDGVVPLSLAGSINQLWAVCCLLTSYQGPLDIKSDKPV